MANLLLRSRLRAANLPPRSFGVSLSDLGVKVRPENALTRWLADLSDGKILRAVGQFETCGMGLFLTGRHSSAVAATLLQEALTGEVVESGLYVMAEDYLASERPEGDRRFSESIWSDLLVLSRLGTERRTDFAREVIEGMLVRRFDRGLPTIIASGRKMRDLLPEDLSMEALRQVAIMEVSREED